jgi:hypothetical protein
MKKITINSCGDCPFIDSDYHDEMRVDVCGIAPLEITDLKRIHPQCELSDN